MHTEETPIFTVIPSREKIDCTPMDDLVAQIRASSVDSFDIGVQKLSVETWDTEVEGRICLMMHATHREAGQRRSRSTGLES
jgi:hypothetical protein